MNHRQRVIGVIAAVLALAVGVFIGLQGREAKHASPALPADSVSRFFATRLNDDAGRPQPVEQWRGKTLVVNFWATWCQPCREEMPALSRLQAKHAASGVQFVGIALDNAANVVQFKQGLAIGYPLLIAENEGGELTRQLGNDRLALPYTVVFGADGRVAMTKLGRIQEQELDKLLLSLPQR